MIYVHGAVHTCNICWPLCLRYPSLFSSPSSGELLFILQNPTHLPPPFFKSPPASQVDGVAALCAPTSFLFISLVALSLCLVHQTESLMEGGCFTHLGTPEISMAPKIE